MNFTICTVSSLNQLKRSHPRTGVYNGLVAKVIYVTVRSFHCRREKGVNHPCQSRRSPDISPAEVWQPKYLFPSTALPSHLGSQDVRCVATKIPPSPFSFVHSDMLLTKQGTILGQFNSLSTKKVYLTKSWHVFVHFKYSLGKTLWQGPLINHSHQRNNWAYT